MPLLPVSTARISTPLATQRLLFQLQSNQLDIQRNYDQLSSGRRVLRISDDPIAASQALRLHHGIDRGQQLVRNAESTARFYRTADNALARVDSALIEARAAAVQAAETILSDDERAALSYTIQQTINSVLASGNSIYRDHALLGGFLAGGEVLRFDGEEIVYRGNQSIGQTDLGAGRPSPINVTGNEALGASSVFLVGEELSAGIDRSSRLSDLRRGAGVTPGILQFSSGGSWVDLDLRAASTIGDLVDMISTVQIDGRAISAALTADGIRVEYADGLSGTLAIADSKESRLAVELGISNPSGAATPPLIGDQLSPRVTTATAIEDLGDGGGLDLSAGIQIGQGGKTFAVDLSEATTLGDVLIAINRSGADVHAELDRSTGRIQLRALRSGVDYSVGENGGEAARALRIRSSTEATLIADLGGGRGMRLNANGPDLLIDRPDGVVLEINLEGTETIADVIDRIRNHPENQDSRRVLVGLSDIGNGLQLKAPPGDHRLTVRQTDGSDAGVRLGLIPDGSQRSLGSVAGATDTIRGADYASREAGGALDTLLRLKRAVLEGDPVEIASLQQRLDADLDRSTRARGRVGVWASHLEQLRTVSEDRVVELQSQLSDEIDADLATVISDLSQKQLALEASMRVIGQTAQLSVLNFL